VKVSARPGAAAAVLLGALVGYGAIVRPIEARIAEHDDEIAQLTDRIETRLGAERKIAVLQDERHRLLARLHPLHLADDRARIIERFFQLGARTGRLHDASITAIAADAPPVAGTPERSEFDEVPLVVTLRGSYGSLLQTIRDFSTSDVPVRLTVTSLVAGDRRGEQARGLVATVRVVLLRMPDQVPHARS
jgi:hypothetical protein